MPDDCSALFFLFCVSPQEALGLLEAGVARGSSSARPPTRRGGPRQTRSSSSSAPGGGGSGEASGTSSSGGSNTNGGRRPRLGFDRLRDHGLSREEVESLRVFFGAQAHRASLLFTVVCALTSSLSLSLFRACAQ